MDKGGLNAGLGDTHSAVGSAVPPSSLFAERTTVLIRSPCAFAGLREVSPGLLGISRYSVYV